jgi:parallel beta-helix repeat protein
VSGGDVNLTNLYVGGQGFSLQNGYLVGILYQQSAGTINQVITATQDDNGDSALNVTGFGIVIEGGSLKQSVTVENCSIHDFSQSGIFATANQNLTVTIKNNAISTTSQDSTGNTYDIFVDDGTEPTVSGNIVSGGLFGIAIDSSTGSITGNTVLGSVVGITLAADGASVTSNNIYDTVQYGISVVSRSKNRWSRTTPSGPRSRPAQLTVTGRESSSSARR